ncbi:serine hydrolase domain-containing protein [Streptomyces aureoverticillatus]|uniref:serine hydrolase domain-containing protein n=1 Tax=Streptomyces aureoverticillatus TaxID=66871 RepID=UPI0013D9EBA8|nr:serine hydrolase domain-containing protein [Streptomyces aureoverticillatus]QIB45292.1 beta-lactamase family protein [Streptomyces aureoverticillatus]
MENAEVDGAAVHGTVADGFEPVRDAFVRNFAALGERGAGVVVYRDGRPVVDLWGGVRDFDGTEPVDGADAAAPWERGTAQVVRSATKGVAAAALLLLHQRGELDLDAPVGAYWPEFKAHGKDRVLVRHVLAHRAGVPALDRPLTPEQALDPDAAAAAVAAQAPFWEPGTDHGYHAHTYSWLTGELVRRVTGRSIRDFVADEIAGPLGLDLWVGLPASEAGRVGRLGRLDVPAAAGGLRTRAKPQVSEAYRDPASLTRRAFDVVSPFPDENSAAYRSAVLPASNGIATAGGLAGFYASLIGEVDSGTRLFDPSTLALARAEASAGADRVLVVHTRLGLGYMLHGGASPLLGPESFGHPGRGGALGFADPGAGIAFGYVTNGMGKGVTADARAQGLVRAVRVAAAA